MKIKYLINQLYLKIDENNSTNFRSKLLLTNDHLIMNNTKPLNYLSTTTTIIFFSFRFKFFFKIIGQSFFINSTRETIQHSIHFLYKKNSCRVIIFNYQLQKTNSLRFFPIRFILSTSFSCIQNIQSFSTVDIPQNILILFEWTFSFLSFSYLPKQSELTNLLIINKSLQKIESFFSKNKRFLTNSMKICSV